MTLSTEVALSQNQCGGCKHQGLIISHVTAGAGTTHDPIFTPLVHGSRAMPQSTPIQQAVKQHPRYFQVYDNETATLHDVPLQSAHSVGTPSVQ